ncbi:serine hydrolase domain-containing protein [Streptosporangium roseum]|uniref:serine hydrolase domain-containing protein n=1 Tax=Streptosporangium roseum TaxID=2001 RepID=UPI0004CDD5FC|nr:serine hydrolase domain-containing protein [Streptosporangium roseum]
MPAVPFTADDTARLQETLTEVVADGATPGGVIVCGTTDGQREILTAGVIASEVGNAAPTEATVYDVASLTKVVAAWPLVGRAVDAGLLDLDAPVRDALPVMSGEAPSGEATVRQLLAHTAGLRAATRLDHYRGADAPLHELLCREPLEEAPGRHRYINRGYILLGLALAHICGRPLDALAAELWQGMGMRSTMYGPVGRDPHVAPTEQRIPGASRIWGAAHDENAALMGGVAGHAGVFSTPNDLAVYAQALLDAYETGDGGGLSEWLRASLVPQAEIEPGLDRGLSWILPAGGPVAYHHGFTGTSLYLAPAAGRYLVICTNAVYHGAARTRIAPLRTLALKTVSATSTALWPSEALDE